MNYRALFKYVFALLFVLAGCGTALQQAPPALLFPATRSAPIESPTVGAGAALITFRQDSATAVAWSPDGRRIASASRDGPVQVWQPG